MREPRFTREQMQEIGKARERLLSYKDKIQMYPPIETPKPLPYYPPALPEHRLINKLRQVEGIANYAKTSIQQHLEKKKRKDKI